LSSPHFDFVSFSTENRRQEMRRVRQKRVTILIKIVREKERSRKSKVKWMREVGSCRKENKYGRSKDEGKEVRERRRWARIERNKSYLT